MLINDEIEKLHHIITNVKGADIIDMGIFNRLYAIGIVSMMNRINMNLEKLNDELETSLKAEAVSINFNKFLNPNSWKGNGLFIDIDKLNKFLDTDVTVTNNTTEINLLTDYLPNGIEGYNVTPDVLDSFKTAIHQLCDEEKLSYKTIVYSLSTALARMLQLLKSIQGKVNNPKPHLFAKLWEELSETYCSDDIRKEFIKWKNNNVGLSFEELKTRQKQELYKMLNKNFLRYLNMPSGAAVKKRKLKINEDDLEYGTTIPPNLDVECAKFDKFIEWEGEHILTINYEKFGQYIHQHFNDFEEEEIAYIIRFDGMLEVIHEEMAKIKPNLRQYLKRYKDNQVIELQKECTEILSTCKCHLHKDVREGIFADFISKLLFDPKLKLDARSKLNGQSKFTYICEIVAYLKWYNVFKPDASSQDLAATLKEVLGTLRESTIKKYIDNAYNTREGALFDWTSENIDDLKARPYNPYEELF